MKSSNNSSMPKNSSKAENDRVPIPLIIVFVVLLLIWIGVVVYYKYLSSPKPKQITIPSTMTNEIGTPSSKAITSTPATTQKPMPTPTRTPRPIPHGKTDFSIGLSDKSVPQLGAGSIDPYDPQKGSTQTVTIHVSHSQPVTKVTAILKTDTVVSKPVSFRLVKGSNTDGDWQGSWKVNDTYLYTYNLLLQAESANGQSKFELTLR